MTSESLSIQGRWWIPSRPAPPDRNVRQIRLRDKEMIQFRLAEYIVSLNRWAIILHEGERHSLIEEANCVVRAEKAMHCCKATRVASEEALSWHGLTI